VLFFAAKDLQIGGRLGGLIGWDYLSRFRVLRTSYRLDAMRGEVQKAATIDEAASIRDQAEALRAYAKQRHDPELEMWMGEIKVRAAARIGELSRELDTSKGGSNPLATLPISGKSKAAALAEAGISTSAAQRYV
jgi:hypothetical protein